MRRLYVMLVSVMSVMIATLLIAAATGAAAAQDQRGPTTERIYGAQWVSPSLGSSYFVSARDLSAAIERAGSECERAATDCAPGVWVKNGYASFAMDVTGAWGTGWGKYKPSANAAAVADCEFNGGMACSVLQTNKTASYNTLGLTEGGILPVMVASARRASRRYASALASFANSLPLVHPTFFSSFRTCGGKFSWIDIK